MLGLDYYRRLLGTPVWHWQPGCPGWPSGAYETTEIIGGGMDMCLRCAELGKAGQRRAVVGSFEAIPRKVATRFWRGAPPSNCDRASQQFAPSTRCPKPPPRVERRPSVELLDEGP